jgi:hypothetical protein
MEHLKEEFSNSIREFEKKIKNILNPNKNLWKITFLSFVVLFVLAVSFLVYFKFKKDIFHTKTAIKVKSEANVESRIKELNEVSGEEICLDSDLKRTDSFLSAKSASFDKIQRDVFNAVNSQYFAENLLTQSDKTNNNVILTNLNHISDVGIFMIAPVEENAIDEKVDEHKQPEIVNKKYFFKSLGIKRLNFKSLSSKRQNLKRKRSLAEKLIDHNIKVVFNMNTYQQKYFLDIFGPEKNPIMLAKSAFKQKFRKKKTKLKRKIDKINLKNQSKLSLSSICSTYSSMLLEDSLENLDKRIKDFLDNPLLNQVGIRKDFSGGLGRNNIIKLRRLVYKHGHKSSRLSNMEEKSSFQNIPDITIDIYNVKKVKSFSTTTSQQDNEDQDSKKLAVLAAKKHK